MFFNKIRFFLLLLTFAKLSAQQPFIGKVIDAEDNPLPGVSILVKGTTRGTVSDFDGNFRIENMVIGEVLEFSYVGMTTVEIIYEGQDAFEVQLSEDSESLSEVVVTGYEDISKKLFTGVSKKIDVAAEKIDGSRDVSRLLEGKDAGVVVQNVSGSFGASPQIIIRGNTTISGNNDPIWVVDGVVLENNIELDGQDLASGDINSLISSAIAGLNPEDIESFEILKDASATALYGARAKNGVIVINTIKGKFGDLRINYNTTQTIRISPNYNQFDLLNSQDEISVYKEMVEKGILGITTPGSAINYGVLGKMFDLIAQKEISWEGGNSLNNNFLRRYQLANTDWFKTLFKTNSVQQQHSISFNGGTEKSNYYFSLGVLKDPGQTLADKVSRYTSKINTTFLLSEKLNLNSQLSFSLRDQRVAGTNDRTLNPLNGEYQRAFDINPFSYALNSSRSITPYDENDQIEYFRRNYTDFNILEELERNYINIKITDVALQTDLKWTISNNIKFNNTFNYRKVTTTRDHIIEDESNQANAYRADDTQIIRNNNPYLYSDPEKPQQQPYSILPEGGINLFDENTLDYLYIRNSLTWNKQFLSNHNINVLLGQEFKVSKRQNRSFDGYGISYDKGYLSNTHPDAIKSILQEGDQYFNISNFKEVFSGSFAKVGYSYQEKYLFNLTARYDGSNLLGKTRLARYLPTWNISMGWNIDQENIFKESNAINSLKLKATYGLTGGRGPLTSAALNLQGVVPLRIFDKESLIAINDLENNDLTFEKLKEYSIGLEYGFFNSRITGEIGYYDRNAYDLIGIIQTSGVGGISFKLGNYAAMKVKGYEFAIATKNIDLKNFKWSTSFNLGYNNESITDLKRNPRYVDLLTKQGAPILGKSISSLYSVRFDKLNNDGVPTFILPGENKINLNLQERENIDEVLKYEGTSIPRGIAGFFSTFVYKDFTLKTNFSCKFDYKIRIDSNFRPTYDDFSSLSGRLKNRWVLPGDESKTTIPAILDHRKAREYSSSNAYSLYNQSDLFIADGTYVRLRSVSLGYRIPDEITKSLGLNSLNLKLLGENLWLIYSDKKLRGQDPEFFNTGGVALPLPKVVTFSINANF